MVINIFLLKSANVYGNCDTNKDLLAYINNNALIDFWAAECS